MIMRRWIVSVLVALLATPALAEPGSPELAAPGPAQVGWREIPIVVPQAIDGVASLAAGQAVLHDRTLMLTVWYPARARRGASTVTYQGALTNEPPLAPTRFALPGRAYPGARPLCQGYPLVVISHGYGNVPAMQAWLGENLASKGYVVVAVAHRDPAYTDRAKVPGALLQRPFDLVATLHALRSGLLGPLADTSRIGLVGYSFGGYGVLTTAGARLDPASPAAMALPKPVVADYFGQGPRSAALHDPAIKAVVAISPLGGDPWHPWGAGLANLTAPLLLLGGSLDHTVGYERGIATIFAQATGSDRILLTFQGAGHSIGVGPVPAAMARTAWNFDWFEDPVWRKARVNAIATHFITAFFDQHLKGNAASAAYFAVPSEIADNAAWDSPDTRYDAISQGGTNPTWKGFVRGHLNGLKLQHLGPSR